MAGMKASIEQVRKETKDRARKEKNTNEDQLVTHQRMNTKIRTVAIGH